jgi:hypothetical protein
LLPESEAECELARRWLVIELGVLYLQALGAIDLARIPHKGYVICGAYAFIVADHGVVSAAV